MLFYAYINDYGESEHSQLVKVWLHNSHSLFNKTLLPQLDSSMLPNLFKTRTEPCVCLCVQAQYA